MPENSKQNANTRVSAREKTKRVSVSDIYALGSRENIGTVRECFFSTNSQRAIRSSMGKPVEISLLTAISQSK